MYFGINGESKRDIAFMFEMFLCCSILKMTSYFFKISDAKEITCSGDEPIGAPKTFTEL